MAKSLARAGYEVVVGSGESTPRALTALDQDHGDSLSYLGLAEVPDRAAGAVTKAVRWYAMLGQRTVRWLDKQTTHPSHVIVYGTHTPLMLRLVLWCRRHHVSLISDVVEWYDPFHVPGGPLGPYNISTKLALCVFNARSNGIVAVSSYLESYYRQRGCPALRVPPTLNLHRVAPAALDCRDPKQPLRLAYGGQPGKKDMIDRVIEAILATDPKGRYVQLVLVGPTEHEILHLPALRSRGISRLPGCIQALGPCTHGATLRVIGNADFMPLLRPPLRYAQAGFPTKITESLAVGTPVICNITSDLGDYIHDGSEGLVCRDHSTGAFGQALERALMLNPQEHWEMRLAARRQAECSFDYQLYSDPLDGFLEAVK